MARRFRICVFTSSRADYGLLYWTLRGIQESPKFELVLLVSGTHLAPEFGFTIEEIRADGFDVSRTVEMVPTSDSELAVAKSMGLGLIGYAEALEQLRPDLLVVLGDRYEACAAAAAATVLRIPIAHCHGGETTEGAVDEAFRHSITKMSFLHFVATESYRNRVIQLGEEPARVHLVGALGLETIDRVSLMEREILVDSLGWDPGISYLVVTFHPVTLDKQSGLDQLEALLSALRDMPDMGLLFTLPNADAQGRIVASAIKDFVGCQIHRARYYESLGRIRYLSAVKHSSGVVGNSSSGLLEAPSLGIGTLNVGDRQEGRIAGASVLHCSPHREAIRDGLEQLTSSSFKSLASKAVNPHWYGRASYRILEVLERFSFQDSLKKKFYDMEERSSTGVDIDYRGSRSQP